MRIVFLFVLLIAWCSAAATTWSVTEVDDPVASGQKCEVQSPASYGSYIYSWPSKYDQVFWPLIERSGLWFCQKSGFIAFIGDFDEISPSERTAIQSHLKNNYSGDESVQEKLRLLEELYALREKDSQFKNMLLRVLARWYQDLGDYENANAYRARALVEMRALLEGSLPEQVRLEYMYVSCNYEVLLGKRSAEQCIPEVEKA